MSQVSQKSANEFGRYDKITDKQGNRYGHEHLPGVWETEPALTKKSWEVITILQVHQNKYDGHSYLLNFLLQRIIKESG